MGRYESLIAPGMGVTPFVWPALPGLTKTEAQEQAGRFRSSRQTTHQLADKVLTVTGPLRPSPHPSGTTATLQFGDTTLTIFAPVDVLGALLAVAGIMDDWQGYGAQTAAMVAEHLLTDLMGPLEAEFGGTFQLSDITVGANPPSADAIAFDVAVSGMAAQTINVSADPAVLAQLATCLSGPDQPEDQPDVDHIPFPLRLMGPSFSLTTTELAASVPGDGFLLAVDWDALAAASVSVADQFCATTQRSARGVMLNSPISSLPPHNERLGHLMTTQTTSAAEQTLPVTMTIELARTTITLADLRNMAPGHVLPFCSDLPSDVHLLANGKPYGQGELVRVDGRVAVRLTKIG